MARKVSEQPTAVEAQILRVLWARGEATLRDVCDDLVKERPVTPSGISTMLKIMVDKNLAKITDPRRPAKFAAAATKAETRGSVLGDIASKFFGGSWGSLARAALGNARDVSDADLAEIRKIVAELEPARPAEKPAVPSTKKR